MSCICNSPVRPSFKDSYNDLLDKPKINGVTLSGNLTAADLGIKAGAQFKIVQQLPVTDIDEATVYLVPVQVSQTDNIYQEWIFINNAWEKIGEPISVEGASASVRWEDIELNYGTSQGGGGNSVDLLYPRNAEAYFTKPPTRNTAYLSVASEFLQRGFKILNTSGQWFTVRYFVDISQDDYSEPKTMLLDPNWMAVLNGTMFWGDDAIIISGSLNQYPML